MIESRLCERRYLKIIYHLGEDDDGEAVFKLGEFYDECGDPLDNDLLKYREVVDYEYHLEHRLQYLEVWFEDEEET